MAAASWCPAWATFDPMAGTSCRSCLLHLMADPGKRDAEPRSSSVQPTAVPTYLSTRLRTLVRATAAAVVKNRQLDRFYISKPARPGHYIRTTSRTWSTRSPMIKKIMEECHLAMSVQIQPNVAEIPKPLGRIVSNGSSGLGGVSEREGGVEPPI